MSTRTITTPTRGEHENHYNTDAVLYFIYVFMVMCMGYYVVHLIECWVIVLNGIFKKFQIYQYYWERQPQCPEKTTVLPKVIDNHYHIMLYRVHLSSLVFEISTLVVIGTNCTGRCESNYHTITTTTVPSFIYKE